MSTKAYYQTQIDGYKRTISDYRSKITSLNDKIKDYKDAKTTKKEYYQSRIKNTKESNAKASYRTDMQHALKSIESDIATKRRDIDSVKTNIANAQKSLKSAQDNKKKVK